MLPHYKVYTRLGLSTIHGIGVFAIADIPAGTPLFESDKTEMVWVNPKDLTDLTQKQRQFYDDFCVAKDELLGCPENFNQLTVAWYMNHSNEPNVYSNNDYDFIAKKDIKDGDELTINYDDFDNLNK